MKKIINLIALLLIQFMPTYGQNWQHIGPFNRNAGNGQGSGRIDVIVYHPQYDGTTNKTVFAASPWGGIWISKDDGTTWDNNDVDYPNLTTDFLPGCGVMDILIDKNDPTTLYASIATGSSKGKIAALDMGIYFPSAGIYKYTPSTGWVAKYSYPYDAKKMILKLAMDPVDPNIVYGCTSDGIIRSTDGGGTWTVVLTAGVDRPFRNVVFKPGTPSIVYACGQDVYQSTNGGVTWGTSPISDFNTKIPGNAGTVLSNIAVSAAGTIYAYVTYHPANTEPGGAFLKYESSTWTVLPIFPKYAGLPHSADRVPITLNTVAGVDYVFVGSILVERYNSSTNTWTDISNYGGNMHPDIHAIVFSPNNSTLYIGHDGGVSKATNNFYSSTPTWATKNNGLDIATLVDFAGSEKDPDEFLAGEIDNGNSYRYGGNDLWYGYMMCDGSSKAFDYFDPDKWYSKTQMYPGNSIYFNPNSIPGSSSEPTAGRKDIFTNSGASTIEPAVMNENFFSSSPIVTDVNIPNLVYYGAGGITRSFDNGITSKVIWRAGVCNSDNSAWNTQVKTIAIAPSDPNTLWFSIDNSTTASTDLIDAIYMTQDVLTHPYATATGCSSTISGCDCSGWQDMTPPWPTGATRAQLKETRITSIAVSDKNPLQIWASYSYSKYTPGYKVMMLDIKGSLSWVDWSNGLPDLVDVTSLVYERGSKDGIYAGTSQGVYYRNRDMPAWIPYSTNFPNARVIKLEINYSENTLRAGTMGRGIWKTPLDCYGVAAKTLLAVNNCSDCNSRLDDFWQDNGVSITNTTLSTFSLDIRSVTAIDIEPNTFIGPAYASSAIYNLFIHGCDNTNPGGSSFKSYAESMDEPIIKNESEHIGIYPNPNNGTFILSVESENIKSVYVYDLLGKVVYQKNNSNAERFDIDITDQAKGIYVVKVIDGEKVELFKVLNQ